MARSRLTQALGEGAVSLPDEGVIAVLGARSEFDLSGLDKARVRVATGFRPDYDAWEGRGYLVGPLLEPADAALVCLPRSRSAALERIAQACEIVPAGAPIIVDGLKVDGIDSVLKLLRKHVDLSPSFSKAHGKIAQFQAMPMPADWQSDAHSKEGFTTANGAFSSDAIDAGSAALVDALPALKGRIADFGAGWGYLTAEALKNPKVTSATLIEADYQSLEAARQNIDDPRADFQWADATHASALGPFDNIISNPPFHVSRQADPELGRAFIRSSAQNLARGGTFFMVANRHLPYELTLSEQFAQVDELPGPPAFKLIAARRPRTKR